MRDESVQSDNLVIIKKRILKYVSLVYNNNTSNKNPFFKCHIIVTINRSYVYYLNIPRFPRLLSVKTKKKI